MGKLLGPGLGQELFKKDKGAEQALKEQRALQSAQAKSLRERDNEAKRARAARRRARVAAQGAGGGAGTLKSTLG